MVKSVETITELIGNTPLVKLNRLVSDDSADVYVKVESFNAGGSVKDRIALNIIETAEKDGSLKPGDTIIEATSGNTGVGLSLVGAAKGYKVITIMPESMSIERRQLMKAYGTEVLLTPAADGFGAAVDGVNLGFGVVSDDRTFGHIAATLYFGITGQGNQTGCGRIRYSIGFAVDHAFATVQLLAEFDGRAGSFHQLLAFVVA